MFVARSSNRITKVSFVEHETSGVLDGKVLLSIVTFSYGGGSVLAPFLIVNLLCLFIPAEVSRLVYIIDPVSTGTTIPMVWPAVLPFYSEGSFADSRSTNFEFPGVIFFKV